MAASKMLRVSDRTHEGFLREAQRRGATIDEVAAAALRALRQKEMGEQLAAPLDADEAEWLDAVTSSSRAWASRRDGKLDPRVPSSS